MCVRKCSLVRGDLQEKGRISAKLRANQLKLVICLMSMSHVTYYITTNKILFFLKIAGRAGGNGPVNFQSEQHRKFQGSPGPLSDLECPLSRKLLSDHLG